MKKFFLYHHAGLWLFLALLASSMSRLFYRLVSLHLSSITSQQLLGAQCFWGMLVLGLYLHFQKQPLFMKQGWHWQLLRAAVAVVAYIFLLESLRLFPLYIATLVGLSTVLLTTVGSIIFLEKSWPPQEVLWGSALGLLGGALTLKGWSIPLPQSYCLLFPVAASILFSTSSLILKKTLSDQQKGHPLSLLFSLLLCMGLLLLPCYDSLQQWCSVMMMPHSWALAALYLISQGLTTLAYQKTDLSLIGPIKLVRLPLAAFWDYTVFSCVLTATDLFAAGLIFLGVVVSKWRSGIQSNHKKRSEPFVVPVAAHTTGLS